LRRIKRVATFFFWTGIGVCRAKRPCHFKCFLVMKATLFNVSNTSLAALISRASLPWPLSACPSALYTHRTTSRSKERAALSSATLETPCRCPPPPPLEHCGSAPLCRSPTFLIAPPTWSHKRWWRNRTNYASRARPTSRAMRSIITMSRPVKGLTLFAPTTMHASGPSGCMQMACFTCCIRGFRVEG
jgi:hypothetical protein